MAATAATLCRDSTWSALDRNFASRLFASCFPDDATPIVHLSSGRSRLPAISLAQSVNHQSPSEQISVGTLSIIASPAASVAASAEGSDPAAALVSIAGVEVFSLSRASPRLERTHSMCCWRVRGRLARRP
jgi:hypothetical protein